VLAVTIALGLASRLYRDVLPFVIAEYAGDTLWATAVFFMLRLVRPAASGPVLAAVTLAIALSVEFSQLAHPPWLDAFRQQPGVALVLGYDFVATDLACYTAGVLLAWAIDAAGQFTCRGNPKTLRPPWCFAHTPSHRRRQGP